MKNRKISIDFIVMLIEVCLCASFAYIANAQEVYQNTLRPELISQRSPQYFVKIAHILFTIAEGISKNLSFLYGLWWPLLAVISFFF